MSEDAEVAAFVAWCKSKPADASYDFMDNANCAYAQFLKETGRAVKPCVGGADWHDEAEEYGLEHGIPYVLWNPLANGGTFGGILARLEAVA